MSDYFYSLETSILYGDSTTDLYPWGVPIEMVLILNAIANEENQ